MYKYEVIVKDKVLKQDMYYKNQIVMTYTIKYPQFVSAYFGTFMDKLNAFYRTKASMYEKTNIKNLFQMAAVEYEYSIANNYPIRQFEAYTDYQVTFNQNCALSLYFDQYEYAGGAHGLTVRSSDTWNLQRSRKIELQDVIVQQNNLREYLANIIIAEIERSNEEGNSIYFDDPNTLVNENLKLNNFYLTEEGVVIYFQQYDIAPYASGLPTFLIPYSSGIAVIPSCCY